MAELKTRENDGDVDAFLAGVENDQRRQDCRTVLDMMRRITGMAPKMWGDSIVGFDRYSYTYASGHGGTFFITGFAPRKKALTIYIMPGYGMFDKEIARLGKVKTDKSCLYVNRLDDIDLDILEEMIARSVAWMRERYPKED